MDVKDMKANDVIGSNDSGSGQVEDFDVSESALIRKIDWRIVPTLFLAYFLQFLDKVIINVSWLFIPQSRLQTDSDSMPT